MGVLFASHPELLSAACREVDQAMFAIKRGIAVASKQEREVFAAEVRRAITGERYDTLRTLGGHMEQVTGAHPLPLSRVAAAAAAEAALPAPPRLGPVTLKFSKVDNTVLSIGQSWAVQGVLEYETSFTGIREAVLTENDTICPGVYIDAAQMSKTMKHTVRPCIVRVLTITSPLSCVRTSRLIRWERLSPTGSCRLAYYPNMWSQKVICLVPGPHTR